MPRSSEDTTAPESAPKKRAPRKRATTAAAKKAPVKRAPRKTVRKKAEAKSEGEREVRSVAAPEPAIESPRSVVEANEGRKAPTRFRADRESERQRRNRLIVFGVLMAIGVGASAVVGFTDEGQIDVQRTIEARNERIRNNQATDRDTVVTNIEVPVQDTSARRADGGLVGLGNVNTPPPPTPATTTASSSDANATSTATSTDPTASSTVPVESEGEGTEAARPEDAPQDSTSDEAPTS